MTYPRYILRRIGKAFGIHFKSGLNGAISDEQVLLGQAEAQLGRLIWKETESIDALNHTFWNLRKLNIQLDELNGRIHTCRGSLDGLQNHRASLHQQTNASDDPGLIREQGQMIKRLDRMTKERAAVQANIESAKNRYQGAATQIEVIEMEKGADAEEVGQVRQRMKLIENQLAELLNQEKQIESRIEEGDAELRELTGNLEGHSAATQASSTAASMDANQANKDLAVMMNEHKNLEKATYQLHREIGRHVSRNLANDPECVKAGASQRSLMDIMAALRQSIEYNRRLKGSR